MAKAIHTMIRVLDEARSLAFYKKAFGLDIADRLDFPDFTLVYLSNSETPYEVELTINKDRTEPYNLGDGYGHVAFVVEDLDAEHRRFEAEGLKPRKIVEFNNDGKLIARFFFVEDPDGYKIEVLQKARPFPIAASPTNRSKKQEETLMTATEAAPARRACPDADSCNDPRAVSQPRSRSLRQALCSTRPKRGRSTSRV